MILRDLRNGVAGELNYPNYFALQVAAYGMTTDEMVKMNDQFMHDLRPLYLQLHTWVKYKLAEKYRQPVPNRIPAHWLNNRWAQDWTGLVESADLDPYFKGKTAEWIVKTAEDFSLGLGFRRLPGSFWVKSDLYPVPSGNPRKKNTHASCWHIDLETDIRSLQNIEPNSEWFFTAHHELGHGHYFESYTRPEVPPLLRLGANPGFHEGIGELISLASSQVPYLQAKGILPPQSCNYAGNKEVGTWLYNILKKGGTDDWRKVLKEATGEDLSTRAMMEYFQPLMAWLEEQNKGRKIGWENDNAQSQEEKEREERERRQYPGNEENG